LSTLKILHNEMMEFNNVHVDNIEIVLTIGVFVFGSDVFKRLKQVGKHSLVFRNLGIVAFGFGENNPAELFKCVIVPLLESV